MTRTSVAAMSVLLIIGCSAGPSAPAQTPTTLPTVTIIPTAKPAAPTPTPTATSSPFSNLGAGTFTVLGNELYVHCAGSGAPAVILIHGLDGSHDVWEGVEPALSEHSLVCSFDRLNAGDSSRKPGRRTLTQSADELADVIRMVGIPTPVVLVAASLGGEIALIYAGLNPEQVGGLVLVDAVLPLEQELVEIDPYVSSIAGLRNMLNHNGEGLDYYEGYVEADAQLDNLPDVPITYMSALNHDWPNWSAGVTLYDKLLNDFVDELPNGKLVYVESGHDIQWEKPETVVAETESVLAQIDD